MFSGDINEKLFSIIQSEEPHGHLKAYCTSAPYLLKEDFMGTISLWHLGFSFKKITTIENTFKRLSGII